MTARRGDRGSTSVELAILAPVFGLLIAFVVLVGRVQSARADVEAAAHAAARTITLARDPAAAVEAARQATIERLDVGAPSCRSMRWDAQVTSYEATVTVICEVDLNEAVVLPVPGSWDVAATSSEVLDQHVENSREFGLSEGPGGSNPSMGVLH